MSDDNDSQVGGTRKRGSTGCKPLLDAATPELFQVNAFRVTGLPVDATARQISKHFDNLKQMAELGLGASVHTGTFALKPPPTLDQIREAHQRLKDPEQRIIDEFFWFWPEQFGKSTSDAAIQALAGGDGDTAFQIWRTKETNPTDGVVAMHNVAIVWYLTALEWENATASQGLDDDRRRKIETYWRDAFKRWELLATDDTLWEKITARVKQIDDARLTSGFVRRMRTTLPEALDKVNAQLALRYAQAGQIELARMHIQFMRETNAGLDDIEKTAELVLTPSKARVREHIQRTRQTTQQAPEKAEQSVRDLLSQALPLVEIFDLFFGEAEHDEKALLDDAATACINCLVAYQHKTGDNRVFVDLLERTLSLPESAEIRKRIEENIGIGKLNLDQALIEPLYTALKAIQDSTSHPKSKLARVREQILPKVQSLKRNHSNDAEIITDLMNAVAIVLRGISIEAHNKYQDLATALEAIVIACGYATESKLKKQVVDDQKTLRNLGGNLQNPPSPFPDPADVRGRRDSASNKSGIGCLVAIVVIVGVVWIGSCNSNNPSSSSTSYTPPSVGNQDSAGKSTYRISPSMSSELSRDRQAIDSAKFQASLLEGEVTRLAREIETERRFIDNTSQFAVDNFNRKVAQYNAKVEQARAQNLSVNQMVDNYNAKLRQSGR